MEPSIYRQSDYFQVFADQLEDDTVFTNDRRKILAAETTREILQMDKSEVIPLIVDRLMYHPALWMTVLEALTGENPVPSDVNSRTAARYWVSWARENGYGG